MASFPRELRTERDPRSHGGMRQGMGGVSDAAAKSSTVLTRWRWLGHRIGLFRLRECGDAEDRTRGYAYLRM